MFGRRSIRIANCHRDLLALHAGRIALPRSSYDELRAKRDTVRTVIKRRLRGMELPQPMKFLGQGSVSMGTVTRGGYYGSYDIDDGVYFTRAALTGPYGGELTPLAARQRVWDAAYSEQFVDPPEYLKNCVRVYYARGFHIDIPVYRVSGSIFGGQTIELASSTWKPANPRGVTDWFRAANSRSPGFGSNRQLSRMVRYLKVWSRSRYAWQGYMPSGFAITKLVTECYRAFPDRDDRALLHLLTMIEDRLLRDTLIEHPVLRGEFICGPGKDSTVRFMRDRLTEGLERLGPVFEGCGRQQALARWDAFFNENFLRDRASLTFI